MLVKNDELPLTTLENNKSSVNKNPDFGMFVKKQNHSEISQKTIALWGHMKSSKRSISF